MTEDKPDLTLQEVRRERRETYGMTTKIQEGMTVSDGRKAMSTPSPRQPSPTSPAPPKPSDSARSAKRSEK